MFGSDVVFVKVWKRFGEFGEDERFGKRMKDGNEV